MSFLMHRHGDTTGRISRIGDSIFSESRRKWVNGMRTVASEFPVIVVTGANNGIGLHLASALADMSYRVAGLDLSCENLTSVQKAHPDSVLCYPCDLTHDGDVHEAVEKILTHWGRIDVLVNNACLAYYGPFEERNIESIRQEFEVNYFGYIRMVYAVLTIMKAQGWGIIHNISSGVSLTGFPGISGYASSKGAVEALSRTLRLELTKYNIWVTLVHPPLTNTRSSAPLGIPPASMADPAVVGHKLARYILSTKPIITPDIQTAIGLSLSRSFPGMMGHLLAKLAQRRR